jgi:hypothetical protein
MRALAPLIIAFALTAAAHAQMAQGTMPQSQQSTARQVDLGAVVKKRPAAAAAAAAARTQAPRPAAPAASPPLPASSPFSYVRNPAITRKVERDFAAAFGAAMPGGDVQLAQAFSQTDWMGEYAKAMQPYGLRADDLADAITAYWMVSWGVVQGDQDYIPSRTQVQAVRAQVVQALPALAAATPAQRQEFAETLILQALFYDALGRAAMQQADPSMSQMVRQLVRQTAGMMGVDLAAVRLTDQGFQVM